MVSQQPLQVTIDVERTVQRDMESGPAHPVEVDLGSPHKSRKSDSDTLASDTA